MTNYGFTYFLYLARGPKGEKFFYSPWPDMDRQSLLTLGYEEFYLLRPSLPLAAAEFLGRKWRELRQGGGWLKKLIWPHEDVHADKARLKIYLKQLKNLFAGDGENELSCFAIEDFSSGTFSRVNYSFADNRLPLDKYSPSAPFLRELGQALAGRSLLGEEVTVLLNKESPARIFPALQLLAVQGKITLLPAVGFDNRGYLVCRRCGERQKISQAPCVLCGGSCYFCCSCDALGAAGSCQTLYTAVEPDAGCGLEGIGRASETVLDGISPRGGIKHRIEHSLPFALSAEQSRVAGEIEQFMAGPAKAALLWAVCGAGKTEATFPAITGALNNGWKVLFASPRRDVISDLAGRFREAYPGVPIKALYGGSPDRLEASPLTLATTHQTLRFRERFDLTILDEADAYPYDGEPMLARAVARARSLGSKIIYVTATPNQELLQASRRGKWPVITMTARYHRSPLPLPEIMIDRCLSYHGETVSIPQDICRLLAELHQTGSKVLVFVPRVTLAAPVARYLREKMASFFPGRTWARLLQWSHARDRERGKKVQEFLAGETQIFVCTSILERGITVSGVQVAVLFAEDESIYNERSLVQMAGRAGRKAEAPGGRVVFCGSRATEAMRRAVDTISRFNREAFARGLLDDISDTEK